MTLKLLTGAGLALFVLTTGGAAQTDGGPKAVPSQTIRGVTVRLTDIHWQPFQPRHARYTWGTPFVIHYDVHTDHPLRLPPGKSLLDFVTNVTLIIPNGTQMASDGGGRATDASGALTGVDIIWNKIDPRWPLVGVDVEFLDPDAPVRAAGREEVPITISNLPVPAMGDTVRPVHAEAVTPLGTRITVEKVAVLSDPELVTRYSWRSDKVTKFGFRAVTDPAVPDMRFLCSSGITVTDDTGKTLKLSGGSMGGAEAGWPGRPTLQMVGLGDVPAPGAKTMTLTLHPEESSEMLAQESAYRHFRLLVPLNSLMFGPQTARLPLLVRTGKDVVGTVDTLAWDGASYYLRLILHDRADPKIRWQVHALSGVDDGGSALSGRTTHGDDFFWKTDGAPLAPGETALESHLGKPNDHNNQYGVSAPPPAKSLTLDADVEAFREQSHVFDFAKIPIPPAGTDLTLNRAVQDAFGGRLVLRNVAAYSPARPLPPGFVKPTDTFTAASGLVVVLAEPPSPSGEAAMDYQMIAATDTAGRRLRPTASLGSAKGYALLGKSPAPPGDTARVATLFLRLPAPGAQTFNLRMGREEMIPLNRHETLTFSLPAPSQR